LAERHRSSSATEKAGPLLRARRLLGRVRRRFALDTFDVFARHVAPGDERFEPPAGYRFRFGEPADVEACDEHHTELDERERREGVARLGVGHQVVLGQHGDRTVFTMWVNPRNVNIPGHVKRPLSADRSFIYKAYSSPEHRGRGLYEAGMRFVLADLARQGKRSLLGYAHVKKGISRKGLAALGFESLGRFRTLSALGWRRTFVSKELAASLPLAPQRSTEPATSAR